MLKTIVLLLLFIRPSLQEADTLNELREKLGVALQDFVSDQRRSNDFLGIEEGFEVDDFGEIKRQFIEMVREDAMQNNDQETVLEAMVSFQSAGGVFGDPHFVLPLKPGLTICFNWDEDSDEFDNLIATKNLYVNARMLPRNTKTQLQLSEKPRVFVSALAFIVPQYRLNIMIHPDRVTIRFHGKHYPDDINFPLEEGEVFKHESVVMSNDHFNGGGHYIKLKTQDLTFRIILRPKAARPHVNFYFTNLTSSVDMNQVGGIAGQFYNKNVFVKEKINEHGAIINIGDMEARAHLHKLNGQTHYAGMVRECWLLSKGSKRSFVESCHKKFGVSSLTAEPEYNDVITNL